MADRGNGGAKTALRLIDDPSKLLSTVQIGITAIGVIAGAYSATALSDDLTPIVARLAELFIEKDMTLAEINPLARMKDGTFIALDAHMDMENEARGRRSSPAATTYATYARTNGDR
mgnify:CR=1 FL=1